jgi:hypothetical protein
MPVLSDAIPGRRQRAFARRRVTGAGLSENASARRRVRAQRGPMVNFAANPESITTVCDYGFPVRPFGPSRNDGVV